MTIKVNSIWVSNDRRRPQRRVEVIKIRSYTTGQLLDSTDPAHSVHAHDIVTIQNVATNKTTVVRAGLFASHGVRGWTEVSR